MEHRLQRHVTGEGVCKKAAHGEDCETSGASDRVRQTSTFASCPSPNDAGGEATAWSAVNVEPPAHSNRDVWKVPQRRAATSRQWLRAKLTVIIFASVSTYTPANAARTSSLSPCAFSHAGYSYKGPAPLVHRPGPDPPLFDTTQSPALPVAGFGLGPEEPPQSYSVLVTRKGKAFPQTSIYTKPAILSMPHQPGSGPQQTTSNRFLAEDVVVESGGTVGSTELGCTGCTHTDTRVQVTNIHHLPFSAVGELTGQLGTENRGLACTGTLIGRMHVVTAGHCVYDLVSQRFVTGLNFVLGDNNETLQWTSVRVLSLFTSQSTYTLMAMNNDFALITLSQPVLSDVGFLKLASSTGAFTLNLTTAGYPGDKPYGTMWTSLCKDVDLSATGNQGFFSEFDQCQNEACANILQHTCLSTNGQSGSSIWDSSLAIRGIITGRMSTSSKGDLNVGIKITPSVSKNFAQWIEEDVKMNNLSGTLPCTSGQAAGQSTWRNNVLWDIAGFVGVVGAVCCVVLLLILGMMFCFRRACNLPSTKVALGQIELPQHQQQQQEQQEQQQEHEQQEQEQQQQQPQVDSGQPVCSQRAAVEASRACHGGRLGV